LALADDGSDCDDSSRIINFIEDEVVENDYLAHAFAIQWCCAVEARKAG